MAFARVVVRALPVAALEAGEASVVVSSGRARASVTVTVREGDLGEAPAVTARRRLAES
ncbi:MAG: hypothetical protein OXU64_00130 [Gemmatimonadota bacterium]|nr:hypothetical protein [Gemmatimonadota bacterium]